MKKIVFWGLTRQNGGVDKYITCMFSDVENSEYCFDFVFEGEGNIPMFLDKFKRKRNVFFITAFSKNPIKYAYEIYKISRREGYDVAYCNLAINNPILFAALRFSGCKKIIYHSHNTDAHSKNLVREFLMKMLHLFGKFFVTPHLYKRYACSKAAYKWLYGQEVISESEIKKNAVNLDKLAYNKNKDTNVRQILLNKNKDAFIIGHVGLFNFQKNQTFVIKIFKEIISLNPNSKLMLIGNGPDMEKVKQQVSDYGLTSEVLFLGFRDDVYDLYQAMDVFVLPSRYEGLPIVGIEAQAAGLPCFFSDNITRELSLTPLAHFLSIEEEPLKWAKEILKYKNYKRLQYTGVLRKLGYDLEIEKGRSLDYLQ